MAGETTITVIGNLVDDPELRFTPSGAPVANFRIASTPRTFDRQTNEWKDGDTLFLNCSIWRQAAENVAESLQRGMRVVVQGRLKSRQYETREGEKRTVFEIEVEEVGPSLKYATAKVTRANLDRILTRLKQRHMGVVLAGVAAPPEMGRGYARDFEAVFQTLAKTHRAPLYPNLLAGVARNPALNQADGIHPNSRGVAIIAKALAPVVARVMAGRS